MAHIDISVTRDSVCAGDDADAPHELTLACPRVASIAELVRFIAANSELPSISGGEATWCLSTHRPLAITAQQWTEPRMLVMADLPASRFIDVGASKVRMHWSYFAQENPDVVFRVLSRLSLATGG